MVRAHWNGAVIAESDDTVVIDAHGHEIDREIGVPGRRRLEQLVRSAGLLAQATTGRGAA